MATFTHALGHTLDGKLRGGEPDIKQMHKIAQFMGLRHECVITSCCQGGFNRKGHSFLEESLDAVEHDTPRLYGHALGMEGRKAFGDFIGVDKLLTVKDVWQDGERRGGFSRTVATGDDV